MDRLINKVKVRRWWLMLLAALLLVGCSGPIGRGDLKWHKLIASHSRHMDMGGYKLHYLDLGQGRPVVMIHGFADSTYCWHANAKALLEAGLRLILVDQPGLGQSGIPPAPYTYSLENQAAAVMKLCDHLGLKRFSLVGSSMGGGIALYLAWRHPGRVERMVLLDPACFEPPGIRWLALPGAGYLASLLGGRWSVGRGLKSAYYRDDLVNDAVIDEYARPTQKKGFFKVLSSLSSQYFSPAFHAMTKAYGQIKTPALIIWGQFDTWVPPEYGRRLHKALAGSELKVIKDTGHLPHQEDPRAVNRLLVDFLTHGKTIAYRLNALMLPSK
jgi:pimeloyl-ACP methyl ester carboxylesterase